MPDTEMVIPYSEINDGDKITGRVSREFTEHGMNIHVNEVKELIDDDKRQVRVLKVKNSKYFSVPDLPWKR